MLNLTLGVLSDQAMFVVKSQLFYFIKRANSTNYESRRFQQQRINNAFDIPFFYKDKIVRNYY